jgi:hypothetical protein
VLVAVEMSSASEVRPVAPTLAVSLTTPGLLVVTTIVIVALRPPARVPTLQVTVPFFLRAGQVPCVVEAESKWTVPGNGSVTVTPFALWPPALAAEIV